MKKVALVFVIAILLPSLVLAWLALRSLRDQQFLLERQQSLLCQSVADGLAGNIAALLAQRQQEFAAQVESLAANKDATAVGMSFDRAIREAWPLAEVGFCVTRSGRILSPSPGARDRAGNFYKENSGFLGNRETAEVYGNVNPVANNQLDYANNTSANNAGRLRSFSFGRADNQKTLSQSQAGGALAKDFSTQTRKMSPTGAGAARSDNEAPTVLSAPPAAAPASQPVYNFKAQPRKVVPQNSAFETAKNALESGNLSQVLPAEGEFSQLIGDGTDGMLARFLQNKLNLMFWHQLSREPDLIFGAQLDLNFLVHDLRPLLQPDPALGKEIYFTLLDDNAKPVA